MITSFQFARMLAAELRQGEVTCPDHRYYRVTGRLDIVALYASIEIRVWQDFAVFKRNPPAVWCHERWMRSEDDWHNSRATGMCWILQEVWCDGMNWKDKPVRAILDEGRNWLINDVRCLVGRHYIGHVRGLKRWPKEWASWGHHDKGREEYEREQKRAEASNRRFDSRAAGVQGTS